MGDCVLTTPALKLLSDHRPDLDVRVAVEPRFAALFEKPLEASAIREFRPHLVLNFHGGTRSLWLTALSGAALRAGFAHHRYSWIYNHRIPRAQEILGEERRVHTAEHLASAMFYLGVPNRPIPRAQLPTTEARERRMVIHPFAARPDKVWPAARFVEVAHHLRDLKPLVLAGPGDDTTPFLQAGYEVLANAPLPEVMSRLAAAPLFLGNDSGPAHIAAAYGVPVAVIFGPSNPITWAPWRTTNRVLTSQGQIERVDTAQVIAACDALL